MIDRGEEGTDVVGQELSGVVVVMRHSVRVDIDEEASWLDQSTRPYDSPISDPELPVRTAASLQRFGIGAIASSPFRRCLETAGHVARTLGVEGVSTHFGLGELMHQVRRSSASYPDVDRLTPLDDAAAAEALGQSVSLSEAVVGDVAWDESVDDGLRRFLDALGELRAKHDRLLVVTHGDCVAAAATALFGGRVVVYGVEECGFLAADASGTLVSSARVLMLDHDHAEVDAATQDTTSEPRSP